MDPEQLAEKLRRFTSAFSPGQLISLVVAFVVVIGVVAGSAMWLRQPTYRLLMGDLDAESMGQIVSRLKTMKISYELDEGGRGIRVPASRIDELRLEFATQSADAGMPGWKLFDGQDWGITEFGEKIKYRRAMEGEMARTIAALSEVASARVHIAMGKEEMFGESRPATASVVLKLKAGRSLPGSAIAGITNLVAGGVDGLKPESVVVLDNFGRPLARPKPDDADPAGAASLERQQRLEREYATRVISMLEPIVGPDHVRVNVALTLKRESSEQTQEVWDPNMTVVRSQQTTNEQTSSGGVANAAPPAGVVPGTAGARANLPPTPAQPNQAPTVVPGPSSQRTTDTKNNEIGKTVIRTLQPSGEIARMSVAVLVDDDQQVKTTNGTPSVTRTPRTKEMMQRIQNVVSSSVGFNTDRGDLITVENISFDEPVGQEVQAPNVLVQWAPQIEETARIGAVLVVALLMFLFVLRPMMRRLGAPAAASVTVVASNAARPRTVAELENEIEAQLDAAASKMTSENRRLPVLTKRVAETSQREPEHVAKVLRSWMTEEAR